MNNMDSAREAYEKAQDIFSQLGKDGLAGVAINGAFSVGVSI